jgi:hypothetical protein
MRDIQSSAVATVRASHDRSLLAALRRHAVANGRRCRLAQSFSGCRGKVAKRVF